MSSVLVVWSPGTKMRCSSGLDRLETVYTLKANPVQDCPGPLPSGVDRVEDTRVDRALDKG